MNNVEKLKTEILRAYTQVVRILSYRPYSEKEIREKLSKKKFDSQVIEQVIHKLKEDNLINDQEFANWWAEQRQEFRGKSKYIIKRELAEKGIDKDIVDTIVTNAKGDYETAKAFLERKNRTFARYTGEEYTKKITGFLQRKGFSWEVINKILKEKDIND